METAVIYLLAYALYALILISLIIMLVILVSKIKKHKKIGAKIYTCMIAGMLSGSIITVWICSHRSYPMINDWAFLGNDISTVEQKYEKFERYNKREDGSGYAVLMTEQITGREMYDSNDYSCYNMEFDQTGKIVKVYCSRPSGG